MDPTLNTATVSRDTIKEAFHEQEKRLLSTLSSAETMSATLVPAVVYIPAINQEQIDRANGQPKSINPLAPDEGRYVSLEEYWNTWYEHPYIHIDVSYEWSNGRLEAKPVPAQPQRRLYKWFFSILDSFVNTYPIAELIYLETGFRLTMADLETSSGAREAVRKPDIGVVRKDNPMRLESHERSYRGVCDMCVEAISDSSSSEVRRDTVEKMKDYALAGVREYFILDPSGRHMHFYRLIGDGRYAEIEPDVRGVVRSGVLPGFQFRLRDLKQQRSLEELALDEVYGGYVLREYQAEMAARQKAEGQVAAEAEARRAAEEQAATEAQRAATEASARQKAEGQVAAEAEARRAAEEQAATEASARQKAEGQVAAEAEARRAAEEQAATEASARQKAEGQATAEAEARRAAEEQATAEAEARRAAEKRAQALQDELARLRQQLP